MPALLWAIVIAFLLLTPGKDLPSLSLFSKIPFFDKIVHLILFGFLALLLFSGLRQQHIFSSRRYYADLWAILVAALYAGLTEYVQQLLPTQRTTDILDFVADLAGIFACFFLRLLWKDAHRKSVEKSISSGNKKI